MRPLEEIEEARNRAVELGDRLESVGGEMEHAEGLEGEVSEEIQHAGKIATRLLSVDWSRNAESAREGEIELIRELEAAVDDLERVSSELLDISNEMAEELEGEESFLESLKNTFRGIRSGEVTVSGQGAGEFADILNEAASEVMETDEKVQKAKRDAERAVKEGEKMIEVIENPSEDESLQEVLRRNGLERDARELEELGERVREAVEKSRKASENFESFSKEVEREKGVEDESKRNFMKAAAAASTGMIMGFSGCAGVGIDDVPEVSRDSPDRRNPWGTETLVVTVDHGQQLIEDFDEMLENALSFWERNDERYLGYEVEFSWRESASNPHIRILVEEEIERCRDMTDAELVGCYTSSGSSATIKIEAGYDRSRIRKTLKHELGHALGLRHGDEPKGIMSRNRSERPENFEGKDKIAQFFVRGMELHNSGIQSYRTGIELYRDERWRDARERFEDANQKFGRSEKRLDRAAELADRIGEQDAVGVIERGEANAARMKQATGHLVASIDAGLNGDRDEREEEFEEYQEDFQRAGEVDAPSGEELREALDL